MIALPPFPAEASALRRVLPAVAAVCDAHTLAFNGTQEGFGAIPSMLLFTDHNLTSASYGTTFAVPLPATAAQIEAGLAKTRAKFSPVPANSWGGPVGFDSGADFTRS